MTSDATKKRIGSVMLLEAADEPLNVEVKIMGYRFTYGRHRYLVSPVAGRGQKWVNDDRLLDVQT